MTPGRTGEFGLVLLSGDFRVVGMNEYAQKTLGPGAAEFGKSVFQYHPKKSHDKINSLLGAAHGPPGRGKPVTMIIDIARLVLMINVCRVAGPEGDCAPKYAMTFLNVTEQTGAEPNPISGMVELKRLPINVGDSYLFLEPGAIRYIKSDGNYCRVHTAAESYYVHMSLKIVMARYADKQFVQVHKSYVVNLGHVKGIRRDSAGHSKVIFKDKLLDPVPISKRRLGDLKSAFGL